MLPGNSASPEEGRWRGDRAVAWLIFVDFASFIAVTAVLITVFRGTGFWPWLVMAGAIVVGWLVAVLILIPRSAPRR